MTTRIKVVFYGDERATDRHHVRYGCKVTFTTLEAYKRKISPTLYDAIVHDLEKYGVYDKGCHRIKYD